MNLKNIVRLLQQSNLIVLRGLDDTPILRLASLAQEAEPDQRSD